MVAGRLGDPMNSRIYFFSKNGSVLAAHALIHLQNIFLIPIIIKTSGASVYGAYSLLIALTGFIYGISSFGVGYNCKRLLPSITDYKVRKDIFIPQFTFQLFSLSILIFLLISFYLWFEFDVGNQHGKFVVWIFIPLLLTHFLYSQIADYFRYTHRIGIFNYATTAQPYLFIGLISSYWYIYNDINVNSLLIAISISSILVTIPLICLLVKEIRFDFVFGTYDKYFKDIKLGLPLTLSYVVDVVIAMSDRFVIAAFLGVAAVGYYIPAYTIGMLPIVLAKVFGVVLPPMMSRLVDNDSKSTAEEVVNLSIKIYLMFSIPFVVGCFFISKEILVIFTSQDIANQSFMVTPLIAFGTVFYGIQLIIANILFVSLKTMLLFKVNFYLAIINLLSNVVLLFIFENIIIAACTTVFSYVFSLIYIYPKVSSFWKINLNLAPIVKIIVSALVMGVYLLWYLSTYNDDSSSITSILVGVFTSIFIYILLITFMKVINMSEIKF